MSDPLLSIHRPSSAAAPNRDTRDRTERELDRIAGAAAPKTVRLPLGKLVPLLIDAVEHDRAWLRDFAEDAVQIDADLHDVLVAYQGLTQRAA